MNSDPMMRDRASDAWLVADTAAAAPASPTTSRRASATASSPSDLSRKAIARSPGRRSLGAIKSTCRRTRCCRTRCCCRHRRRVPAGRAVQGSARLLLQVLEQDPGGDHAPYARSQAKILQRQLRHKRSDGGDVCALGKADEPARSTGARRAAGPPVTATMLAPMPGPIATDKRPTSATSRTSGRAARPRDNAQGGELVDAPRRRRAATRR